MKLRQFTTVALLLLVCAIANAQDRPPNLASEGLLGPVKTVEFGRLESSANQTRKAEVKTWIFQKLTFDDHGNRVEAIVYNNDGSIIERLVYTYDNQHRNTGYDEYSSIISLTVPRKHIYQLDERGRISEYTVFDADGSMASRFVYRFDAKGNRTEQGFFNWTGASNGRLVNTYDDAGRVLTETSFDAKGVAPWKNTYKYDAAGRRIEWTQYQSDVLRYKILSNYDDRGRIIEQETLEFNGNPNVRWSHAPVPGKLVYVYDDAKNTCEISTFDSDGSLKGKEVRTRDEKGNDVGWAYFDGSGLPKYSDVSWYDKNKVVRTLSGQTTLKFDYDSHGNWIRKTYFVQPASGEPEPYRTETRNITYF